MLSVFRDPERWAASVEVLVRIGEPAVIPLISILGDAPIDSFAFEALSRIGEPAVLPLLAALQSSNSTVRFWAAAILGQIGDSRAVTPLTLALKDPDNDVRENAARLNTLSMM